MTNGSVDTIAQTKVDNVNGSKMTITYEGGSKEVTVAPGTPIVTYEPATSAALVAGFAREHPRNKKRRWQTGCHRRFGRKRRPRSALRCRRAP